MALKTAFILIGILLAAAAYAEVCETTTGECYYVSTAGDDGNNGSFESPWRTPEHGAGQLGSGDILYIRNGTYMVEGTSYDRAAIEPASGGSSEDTRVIIRNYPGEPVVIDGGNAPTEAILGTWYGKDYITFKGLTIKGLVVIEGTDHTIVEDCDISVGGESGAGMSFGCVLWIENTFNVTIRNNRIHNNSIQGGSGDDLIYEYDCNKLVLENNEIYDGVAGGIALKDNPENVTVRYNYIHDVALSGIWCANQDTGHNIRIYQNIFKDCNTDHNTERGCIRTLIDALDMQIYNNIFDGCNNAGIFVPTGTRFSWSSWNNIFINPSDHFVMIRTDWSASLDDIDYMDHNIYHGDGMWYDGSQRTTLAGWQAGTGSDASASTQDPLLNEDYTLQQGSPALGVDRQDYDGDGDTTETIPMGLYISGDEVIGLLAQEPSIASVSGSLTHGGEATITGSGFGSKTTAAPIIFEDFENEADGTPLRLSGTEWQTRNMDFDEGDFQIDGDGPQVSSSSDINLVGNLSRPNVHDERANEAWINDIGFADTGKGYVNFWVRMDFGTGTAEYYQIKMFRISTRIDGGTAGLPTLLLTHWTHDGFPDPGGYTTSYHQIYYSTNLSSETFSYGSDAFNLEEDATPVWVNVALQFAEGDYNTTNARFTGWASRPQFTSPIRSISNQSFMFRDNTTHIDAIGLHNYLGTGGASTTLYYDNFYVDNSWARVEIGDNESYGNCTKREIQLPTAWSDNSITIEVNQGVFDTGEEAYLFVTDEEGTHSDGSRITIAGSYHPADTDEDGAISSSEIRSYVALWKSGGVGLADILSALEAWK